MNQPLAFLAFAVAATITPGPNNVMVAAAAAGHGVRAVVPHIVGIAWGFAVMLLIVGFGLSVPLAAAPGIAAVLRWVGLAWLFWLAVKIAMAPPPGLEGARPPLGLFGAALFQWINPKAWMMVLATATAWIVPDQPRTAQLLAMSAVFFVVCLPCCWLWAAAGAGAARMLTSPARLRAFNIAMAMLLVLSMLPVVF